MWGATVYMKNIIKCLVDATEKGGDELRAELPKLISYMGIWLPGLVGEQFCLTIGSVEVGSRCSTTHINP
jgi:hypothetical protein